jgi:hypothetical protein
MKLSEFIQKLKSDLHVPVALFVFLVTTVMHVVTHKDLGANYTNSLYAFYGFLAGHGLTQAKYQPDATPDSTTPTQGS